MRIERHYRLISLIVFGLAIALWIQIGLVVPGFVGDQLCYTHWMQGLMRYGLRGVYAAPMHYCGLNYPPVFVSMLDVYAHVLVALSISASGFSHLAGTLAMKVFPILFMVIFGALALAWTWRQPTPRTRFLPALILLWFNPALIMDGPAWGQTDLLFAGLSIVALLLLGKRPFWAGIWFALAMLSKPQAIAVIPILGVGLVVPGRWDLPRRVWAKLALRRLGFAFAGMATATVPIFAFYGAARQLGTMLHHSLLSAVGSYGMLSLHAFNLWWWVLGDNPALSDNTKVWPGFTLRDWSLVLLTAAVVGILAWFLRSLREASTEQVPWLALESGALCYFAMFFLATEMHERYCYPIVLCLVVLTLRSPRRIPLALAATITAFFNIFFVMTGKYSATANTLWIVYANAGIGYSWGRSIWLRLGRQERAVANGGVGGNEREGPPSRHAERDRFDLA